jgi:undecaprenyl diphosphate synthase
MKIPKHIAIIMDGNRRWAKKNGVPDIMGHREGVKSVERITEECAKLGVKALTLYAFSSENWNRSKTAVDALMMLFQKSMETYTKKAKENNIKLNYIGRTERLSASLIDQMKKSEEETANNTGIILTLAINYGARQEIVDAVNKISSEGSGKKIDEASFEKYLYTADLPELDLIIRTSGEMRISNFLLWQVAYSEIYVTDTLWPDFDEKEFKKALEEYTRRERRYGE